MTLEYQDLTWNIIGAGIEVHRELGPGFIESVYATALELALKKRGVGFLREMTVAVFFQGTQVGNHRLDLFVEERVVQRRLFGSAFHRKRV